MATYEYDVTVERGNTQLAAGTLIVDTSTTPPTGSFTPENGTAVTCSFSQWSTNPNGSTTWSFEIASPNGDFPIKGNGQKMKYNFIGVENANGTDPGGTVNWPNPNLDEEFEETVTWQSEATPETQVLGQGAS